MIIVISNLSLSGTTIRLGTKYFNCVTSTFLAGKLDVWLEICHLRSLHAYKFRKYNLFGMNNFPCICIHFNNSWKKFSNYGLQIIHPHYFNSNSLLIKINFWKIKKSKINFKKTYLPKCSINRNYKDTCFLKNYHKSKCSHF